MTLFLHVLASLQPCNNEYNVIMSPVSTSLFLLRKSVRVMAKVMEKGKELKKLSNHNTTVYSAPWRQMC